METFKQQIEAVLEADIRPYLNSHGGNVAVVGIEGGNVKVKLYGACSGCMMADTETIQHIETTLMTKVNGVDSVTLDRELSPELIVMAKDILGIKTK